MDLGNCALGRGSHISPDPPLKSGPGGKAQKLDKFAFRFAVVLVVFAVALAITWAAPPNPEINSAAPIPPSEVIYRTQHWNAY